MRRVDDIPRRGSRLAGTASSGTDNRRLAEMTTSLKAKLEKYHANYVSRRQSAVVATSPEAMRLEARARELESSGKFRLAARQWLPVFDAAEGDVERARIAMRRDQCITLSNTRRFTETGYEMAGRFIG